jgi:MFS family permease
VTESIARPAMGARALLRLPDFRRLFVAQAISDVGDGFTFITLLFVVNQLTHSTAALAIMSIAVALPQMTIGLVAGAYADRLDRRRIMLASDAVRGLLVLGFVATATVERLPLLYLLALVQASIGTFFTPARGALVPHVVPAEGLLAANSITQVARIIANLVGTGIAGVVVALTGTIWPSFVIDAATFFASVAIVYGVSREAGRPDPAAAAAAAAAGILSSVSDGLGAIRASRVLTATVVGVAGAMLGLGAVNVLFVPFLVNVLHESTIWAGPLEAAQTLSMILAGGLVATLAGRLRPSTIITGSMFGVAVIVGLFSIVPNVVALMVLLFAVGWFVTPLQAAATTLLQTSTADAVRGRVLAALNAATSTTTIVSTAAAGIVADLITVRTTVAAGAGVVAIGALAAWILFAADHRATAREAAARATDPTGPTTAPAA